MESPPISQCTVELLCRLCRSLCRSSRSLCASCLWANLLRWALCAIACLWASLFYRTLGAGRALRSRSLLRSTTTTNHNYSGQNDSSQRKNLLHSSKFLRFITWKNFRYSVLLVTKLSSQSLKSKFSRKKMHRSGYFIVIIR